MTTPLAKSSSMEDSLVKRLAGPSTGKAGLAKDQTEINRIIAEASKGSKFYDNEKRKDQELTAKIKRLLEERELLMRGVDAGEFAFLWLDVGWWVLIGIGPV